MLSLLTFDPLEHLQLLPVLGLCPLLVPIHNRDNKTETKMSA